MNQKNKENLVSVVFTLVCLILYFSFPVGESHFEIFLGVVCFLFLLPFLYTKYVLKKKNSTIGFTTFSMSVKDTLFIVLALIFGVASSFLIASYNLGVNEYVGILSKVVISHFGAFMLYEILFSATLLFLFTFFTWGFICSIDFFNKIYTKIVATLIFLIFIMDFYENVWIAMPLLISMIFIIFFVKKRNVLYIFSIIFVVNLIMDALIIKTLS